MTTTRVTLWTAFVADVPDALFARYRRLLTEDEARRADRFVFEKHRREYLVTRALARAALSGHREVAPEAWRFVRDERGKPSLRPPCGLEFNLSNHPSLVVCAVTEGVTVGVDVEPVGRGREILDLAERVFSPTEREALAELPPEVRADRAVSLWTAKEAYIKARGDGLSLPLDAITIPFDGEHRATDVALSRAIDDGIAFTFACRDLEGHRVHVACASRAPLTLDVRRVVPLAE